MSWHARFSSVKLGGIMSSHEGLRGLKSLGGNPVKVRVLFRAVFNHRGLSFHEFKLFFVGADFVQPLSNFFMVDVTILMKRFCLFKTYRLWCQRY